MELDEATDAFTADSETQLPPTSNDESSESIPTPTPVPLPPPASKFPMPPPTSNFPMPPSGAMMDPSVGTYHPDFLFCGACTTCQETDEKEELEEEKKFENYLDEADTKIGTNSITSKTTYHFRQRISNPSHILVIRSLLTSLPGVSKVSVDVKENTVELDHDASTSTEIVLQALQAGGYPAVVQGAQNISDDASVWVRSQFYVRGICCTTEVPVVKRIVKPMPGVSKLQINITTKMVNVEHDVSFLSAQQIAQKLASEGFPATVKRDGQLTAQAKTKALHHSQTRLQVQGVISEDDVPRLQSALNALEGVSRVVVNVDEGVILVDHDTNRISSRQCVDVLLQRSYSCTITIAGEDDATSTAATALDEIGRSEFVESTVTLEGLHPSEIQAIERAIEHYFNGLQVRAIYPNAISQTVKVEHNPKIASISDICDVFSGCGLAASVSVDGAELGLFLPLEETYEGDRTKDGNEDQSLMQIHANVWLSGMFWALSIVSYREGHEWFMYFGLASVVFGLPPICVKAYRTMLRRQFDANCMMVTAAIGALALGEYDEAASVAFLFAVSEFLEARATTKARKAMGAIVSLRPDHANVIHPVTKEIVVIPADRVPLGSIISVKTGDKIACDGIVVEGSSSVDESSLTGESRPAHKQCGNEVSGGTINIGTTQLLVRTTTTTDDSAVSRLIRLVEDAQSNRSPTEKMIDTFARSYTPSVMLLASIMCTIPWYFGPETGHYWTLNGLIIIVIACPCALTISTPVTYAAALAATAQRGVIVKGGAKLEALGSVDRVVFDKTGTLTKGKFSVLHLEAIGTAKSRQEMLQLLALMEERSSHPLSVSLVEAAKEEGIVVPRGVTITDHTILKGEGITAKADGEDVYVGNERLFSRLGFSRNLTEAHKDTVKSWSNTGGTIGFVGTKLDGIIGMFCVVDAVRDEARAVVKGLQDSNIDTMICTGDSHTAAYAVANAIGIPLDAVHSQLLPEDKLHFVGSLKRPQPRTLALCRDRRYVLFCGDGVNDAPALAVADIGMSMGEGAAMAMEMSDITLMDSHLTKLSYVIKMGRRVLRTVKENILISLAAKAAVVALTFMGQMTLLFAITSDVGIMLLVTLNGMKLLPTRADDLGIIIGAPQFQRKARRRKAKNGGIFEMTPTIDTDQEGAFDAKDAEIV